MSLWKKYKNFIIYCLIGFTGLSFDMGLFYVMFNMLHINYMLSNAASMSLGITNNFILNAFFNFKKTDKFFIRFLKFYLVGIFGILLSNLILYVFHDMLDMNANIVKAVSIVFIAILQFMLNRRLSFA
ncbi:MAG: GtrA family protein [Candidatus Dojkabacteria bacterium]|nr:MAG: GtrA family protein [Candidatus Dojkabacteria bacterium]